jgi:hypothetical protein
VFLPFAPSLIAQYAGVIAINSLKESFNLGYGGNFGRETACTYQANEIIQSDPSLLAESTHQLHKFQWPAVFPIPLNRI